MPSNIFRMCHSMPELIISQALDADFRYAREARYLTQASTDSLIFDGASVEWKQTFESGRAVSILRFDGGMLHLVLQGESLMADAFGVDDEKAKALLDLVREKIPPAGSAKDGIVVSFWRQANPPRGTVCSKRQIDCPAWKDVRDNYVGSTRGALEQLFHADFESALAGKLVLWHGEPGTGKTFALRSWGRECGDEIDINYIADPERFFGADADYMLELLTREPSKKLNLFVAEDTGELLTKDAKRETGQALSRLLNVCDGLIGQGLRILVLITTNEDLGTLHPAVVRPGRCYANIGFETFNESEAGEWLRSRGINDAAISSRSTIAQLYAVINDNQIVAQKPKIVGFVQ